jgi:hypothetical protein
VGEGWAAERDRHPHPSAGSAALYSDESAITTRGFRLEVGNVGCLLVRDSVRKRQNVL